MKNELRSKYLEIRRNILDKNNKDNIIYHKVIHNEKVKLAKTILIYVSKEDEVDTINLIKYFLTCKKVAVPKIENNEIEFYYINSINDLKPGYFHVLEPISNNKVKDYQDMLSITPGICFSKLGYRIGYGKGFYDRFYQKNHVYSLGLCYKECLVNNSYHDSYDQKVDEVITD